MTTQLSNIFNDIQSCTKQTYSIKIQEALELIVKDKSFLRIIHAILASKRTTIPDRIVSFLKRIFERLNEEHKEILDEIFCYLLDFIDSKSNGCRRHTLNILSIILNITKQQLSSDALQRISERLFDRDAGVRKGAVKICLSYQDSRLGNDLRLVGVIKDLVRFDQSSDIRRMVLVGIAVTPGTINCIVERCTDISMAVRKAFWNECFENLPFCDISTPQRIYLMRSAVVEREFDAKSIFIRIIQRLGLSTFVDCFYSEDSFFFDVLEGYLRFGGEVLSLTRFTPGYVSMMYVYYKLREEELGRDCLDLMDLEEFLCVISERCSALESNAGDVKVVVGLFKLLSFYDLFDDQERRKVLKIIKNLLTKCNVKDVVDEAVLLCKRLCGDEITVFLGSIVKKLRGTPLCYVVSACIIKNLPYSELHKAILQEIAIQNLNESLEIIFWYFFHQPSKNLEELLLSFLPNTSVLNYSTDLVISGHVEINAVLPAIEERLFNFDGSVAVLTAKLLLSKKLCGAEYFKHLLLIFYSTDDESIQQYLSLFFHEYFSYDSLPLIDIFCDVLQLITDNYRIFADQAFFWITNSNTLNGSQRLFLNICGSVLRCGDELKNRRYFFFVLDRITVDSSWEPVLTKKIIYLIGQIIRMNPKEQVQNILVRLLAIDDGVPLDVEEYALVREEFSIHHFR